MQRFTIGTRGSPLALYQARRVQSELAAAYASEIGASEVEDLFPIRIYTTSGDTLKGALSAFGGKGLFTKELETALLDGDIDMAVHSMKDVPTQHQPELSIGAILERADTRDALICRDYGSISNLPKGACVGTASLRRRAQLAHVRPDLTFSLIRGNVGTRLMKLERGDCDATILAYAGLTRLGMGEAATEIIDLERMLNAPAQAAIGIEIRMSDVATQKCVRALNHATTEMCIVAERAFLAQLDGSCRTPIAALAKMNGSEMVFRGEVYSVDGTEKFTVSKSVNVTNLSDCERLGRSCGFDIQTQIGGRNIWDD